MKMAQISRSANIPFLALEVFLRALIFLLRLSIIRGGACRSLIAIKTRRQRNTMFCADAIRGRQFNSGRADL